jgi:hypothetical protein
LELATDIDDLSLYAVLRFTGTLIQNTVVIAPGRARVYVLENATTGAYTLTFTTSTGTGLSLAPASTVFAYSDSVNVYAIGESSASALPIASESIAGITRYGTSDETIDGLLNSVAVTPVGLSARLAALPGPPAATTSVAGIASLATSAEGITGTNNTKIVTPLVLQSKINALPLASETVVGLSERATQAETITGTDTTRFVTPATLQAKINTLPVIPISGTAYSVVRIPSTGTGQEATPNLVTGSSTGWLGIGATTAPQAALHIISSVGFLLDRYSDDITYPPFVSRKNRGTSGTPQRLQANDRILGLQGQGYVRSADNTSDAPITLSAIMSRVRNVDAQGRAGADLSFWTSTDTSAGITEKIVMLPSGYLGLGLGTLIDPVAPLHIASVNTTSGQLLLASQKVQVTAGMVVSGVDFWSNDGNLPSPGQLVAYVRAVAQESHTPTTLGTSLSIAVTRQGTAIETEVGRFDQFGNLRLGGATLSTALQNGLTLKSGVAATATGTDQVALWTADTGGVANKAGLHLRSEDGTSHVLGDVVGIGTLCAATLGLGAYQALNVNGSLMFVGASSVQERTMIRLEPTYVVSTDATRTARLRFIAFDATAARECLRIEASGTVPLISFFGVASAARQTVPAAATDAATTQALVNALRTALITFGLCQ